MRKIGMVGFLVFFITASAWPDDGKKPCLNSVYGAGEKIDSTAQPDQLYLTDNQCESVTGKELRLKLFEIPQDEEKPMSLSVGAKNLGGILRFKIPFSF